ncbi:nuclear transport factor 2 family protein [Roseitranquillus sediminis]|uniref:nuclear transport factor 2 family protein n=1 Tax=Roseitranquillus sediminis TaxID=2809051 RepID=UPI001D0C1B5A|nr:nuclear transport factor 2 family protein [Roseitranquillus sediminis]MBM9594514.1 nuclear transport factor 2 family protein [Roseitranquillus sediminis]
MNLPAPVETYFEADQRQDGDALVSAFATDAVVRDEGAEHHGAAAIRAWWLAAKQKYHHIAEPLEMADTDEGVRVRARVSGRFPNSPAMLTFSFALAGDRIAGLEIG